MFNAVAGPLGVKLMDRDKLLDFFEKLDRSVFVDNGYKELAGLDRPLPIGHGQTISQPSLVMEMTWLLDPDKDSKVLEIGTGSGYQTALLAEFSDSVYTVERIPEFSEKARERLDRLGYGNITYIVGDGSEGCVEHAPYDRIMVTAAAEKTPPELLAQLKAGGRMVIPVGLPGLQELLIITKDPDGRIRSEAYCRVAFVEMKGKYGWNGNGRRD
jgi:protein-L-isoaspartate(D-aspartate) O-methyltransferase